MTYRQDLIRYIFTCDWPGCRSTASVEVDAGKPARTPKQWLDISDEMSRHICPQEHKDLLAADIVGASNA